MQILEYHPQMLQEYLRGGEQTSFMYPRYIKTFRIRVQNLLRIMRSEDKDFVI